MRYIMVLLLSLALAVPAFAGFEGPNASTGGFAGPGPQTITKAAQVQNALDDTTCTLEGNILVAVPQDTTTLTVAYQETYEDGSDADAYFVDLSL